VSGLCGFVGINRVGSVQVKGIFPLLRCAFRSSLLSCLCNTPQSGETAGHIMLGRSPACAIGCCTLLC
jgi:hypothetical protein